MSMQLFQLSKILGTTAFLPLLLGSAFAMAATESLPTEQMDGGWNLVVSAIVLAVAAGSALLPISALRHWKGNWHLGAVLPLFVLLIWLLVIGVSKLISAESHQLWPFEIFTWAMLTMVYMVTMMTAKRMIEKKDLENSQNK